MESFYPIDFFHHLNIKLRQFQLGFDVRNIRNELSRAYAKRMTPCKIVGQESFCPHLGASLRLTYR